MPELSTLGKVALVAAAAAASAGVVYYLFRTEEAAVVVVEEGKSVRVVEKVDARNMSVEQLLAIMERIVASQEEMKASLKGISEEIADKNLSFAEAYALVAARQPRDPMEELGISMEAFDELLDKYQSDQRVLEAIARIMGPSEEEIAADDGRVLAVNELVEVHKFMLAELQAVAAEAKKMETDPRTVTAAAQVVVGARVEKKFKIITTVVERSVMVHQNQLASDHEFATINMLMQQAMTELMGSPNH